MTQLINSFFTKNKISFFTFLIFGCICGACYRNEREWWDFANYHYYNAWAFLNDRLNVDVVPAFVNTFFSPFIELPAYFLTNTLNEHPVIFSAIMAVPYGLLLFFAYKIATLFFSPDTAEGKSRIGMCILLYISSDTVLSQISATTHEHLISFLVVAALYPLLKGVKEHHLNIKSCLFSGFVLGAAAGLKMTYALYAASTGIALIVFYKQFKNPFKTILYFTLAGTAGFLVAYGYWGWILWKNFQNPIFPFFNSIFQSPYWDGADYKDIRYFNKSWLTVLFYPVFLFWNMDDTVLFRKTFILSNFWFLFCIFYFFLMLFRVFKEKKEQDKKKSTEDQSLVYFLAFWMAVVYVFWLSFFRVYRYMIPFELMISVLLIHFIFKGKVIRLNILFALPFFILLLISFFNQNYIYHHIEKYVIEATCIFYFILIFFSFEHNDKDAGNKCCILLFLIAGLTTNDSICRSYHRLPDQPLLPFKSVSLDKDTLLILDSVPSSILIPILAKDKSIQAIVNLDNPDVNDVNGSDFHAFGYFANKNRQLIKKHLKQKKPIVYITDIPEENGDEIEAEDKTVLSNCLNLMTHDTLISPRYHLCYDKLPSLSGKE